jgi:hypothetical protein
MQQLFEAMDANHEGVLSRKELEQAPMESQGSWNHRGDIKLGRYHIHITKIHLTKKDSTNA